MISHQDIKFTIIPDPRKWEITWQSSYDKSLLLFLTGKCNLNCTNCFSVTSRGTLEMTLDQVCNIVDANPSFKKVDLMGGEPLLHPNISEIIDKLMTRGKNVTIYTNGILLNRLDCGIMPVRACVSFHEIDSDNPSRKPLRLIQKNLTKFVDIGNALKLVFLLDQWNANKALDIIEFVDREMPFIKKLTLGLMRYENDYWNDDQYGVLPFADYANTIRHILNEYDGRLSFDVFLKGVLEFNNCPADIPNRTNRFKCVFPDYSFSHCLFSVSNEHQPLPTSLILPQEYDLCSHTGRKSCLADKVRLNRVFKEKR